MSIQPFFFRCINESCQQEFDITQKLYQCPACSDLLDIIHNFPAFEVTRLQETFRQRRTSNSPLDLSGVW